MSDAISILTRLTSDEIRARLADLDAEQRQLRVLLRSVAAREREAKLNADRRRESEAAHAR